MNTEKSMIIGKAVDYDRKYNVRIDMELSDIDGFVRLSICGQLGSRCSGQINGTLRQFVEAGRMEYKEGITKDKMLRLLDIWDNWHLNDMNAGCEHQKLMASYLYREGKDYGDLMMIPEFQKCPICGYRYGTAWKRMNLPNSVIMELLNLF